jgi:glycosyltransferase involved in cell wall biosynthesis
MTAQLAIFPSDLASLRKTDRAESMRHSYLFSGFDRTLCAFLNNSHSKTIEQKIDADFSYVEIGFKKVGGQVGMALGLNQAIRKLVRAGRDFKVGAVIAYDPHLLGIVGWMVARALNVPFAIRLISHYGLKYEHTKSIAFAPFRTRRVEMMAERFLYRKAKAVMVACPNHREYVEQVADSGAKTLPYVTAQASLFYEPFTPDLSLRGEIAPVAKKVVVSVTRLQSEKYPQDIVECASHFRGDPDVAFVVVGDGVLRGELEGRALENGARIVFVRSLTQLQIRDLFSTADAVIVLQGGGAITEAALCAAPVVTYDFEMNPFVIRPGFDEGVLVPFRNAAELARAVRSLLDDSSGARLLGRRAQSAARARFSDSAARRAEQANASFLLGREIDLTEDSDLWQLAFGAPTANQDTR